MLYVFFPHALAATDEVRASTFNQASVAYNIVQSPIAGTPQYVRSKLHYQENFERESGLDLDIHVKRQGMGFITSGIYRDLQTAATK